MTPAHHKRQMSANGTSGDNSLRGATVIRWQAPVAVYDAQDTSGCRKAAGGGFFPGITSTSSRRFALTSFDLPKLGRGFGSGPFPSFTDRVRRISSTALSAGDRHTALPPAVGRHPFHCGGPVRLSGTRDAFRSLTFLFKTTDHQAHQSIDPSPATAHSLCLLRCNNHAAKGVVNVQEPVGGFRIV